MRIDIITVLPELLDGPLNNSILKRAQDKGLAEIVVHNLRDFTLDKHRRVDDYPFGGEAGMVMQIEPVDRAISYLKSQRDYDEVIFTSPDGDMFDQPMANSLSMLSTALRSLRSSFSCSLRCSYESLPAEPSFCGDVATVAGESLRSISCNDSTLRFSRK